MINSEHDYVEYINDNNIIYNIWYYNIYNIII